MNEINLVKKLEQYTRLRKEILEYFNYDDDWTQYIIDDATAYYWMIKKNDVFFWKSEDLKERIENYKEYYSNRIIGIKIYRGEKYTMIPVDTNTDGNIYLQIFDNAKVIK